MGENPCRGGSCQFISVNECLPSFMTYHGVNGFHELRNDVLDDMLLHRDWYESFMVVDGHPNVYERYIGRMRNSREWGDNLTLQGLSNFLGVTIQVMILSLTFDIIHIFGSFFCVRFFNMTVRI